MSENVFSVSECLDDILDGQTQRKTHIMTGINQDVYTVSNTGEPAVWEPLRTDQWRVSACLQGARKLLGYYESQLSLNKSE